MALKKISTTSTASGPGWAATRSGGVVVVELNDWNGQDVKLPWPAIARARASLADLNQTPQARCIVQTTGTLSAYDASDMPRLYGQIVYLT